MNKRQQLESQVRTVEQLSGDTGRSGKAQTGPGTARVCKQTSVTLHSLPTLIYKGLIIYVQIPFFLRCQQMKKK